jgi:integrase
MRKAVETYIAVRRAAGFKLVMTARSLLAFADFAAESGDTHITSKTAIAWAARGSSPHRRYRRLRDVVIFARFVAAEDELHEIPPAGVFPYRFNRRPPHLFTAGEIADILAVAGELTPRGSSRPATYQTLFALLAVTGMRVGEALRLTMGDVTEQGLVIRQTKFRKSRLLPLHASTAAALARYRERWRPEGGPDAPFFVTLRGGALAYPTAQAVFFELVRDLGLRGSRGTNAAPSSGPHLHDLRHTFAVRALETCPSEHHAIGRHMTALTTYLGHGQLSATCWYLHASPTLMTGIADACEALDQGES